MAMEKWVRQINAKLDRIAEALGIDTQDVNWNSLTGPHRVNWNSAPAEATEKKTTVAAAGTDTKKK